MSEITAESSNKRVLDALYVTPEEADYRRARGAATMSYPDEEATGVKLRDLLSRGIARERLGWTKVRQSCFVIVRPG